MTWFAFSGLNSGKAIDLAGTQEKQAVATGFHGYGTEAEAEKQPNSVNFITRYEADGFISDYNSAVQSGTQPGGANNLLSPSGAASGISSAATNTLKSVASKIPGVSSAESAISDVSGLASALGNKTLWIRVVKVVAGGLILTVGLIHLTGIDNKAAKAALKYAPLL